MTEGPYRGHVPAKPYTLADSLREYTKAAREEKEAADRKKAAEIWPSITEALRAAAKTGSYSLWLTAELLQNTPPAAFRGLFEDAGLELVPLSSRYGTDFHLSWYKATK